MSTSSTTIPPSKQVEIKIVAIPSNINKKMHLAKFPKLLPKDLSNWRVSKIPQPSTTTKNERKNNIISDNFRIYNGTVASNVANSSFTAVPEQNKSDHYALLEMLETEDASGKKVRVFNFHPIDCYRCEVDRHFNVLTSDEAEQLEKINNNALTAKLSKFVGIKKLVKKPDLSEITFTDDGETEKRESSSGRGTRRVKDENVVGGGEDDDAVRGGSDLQITGDDNGDDNTALEHAYNDDDMEDIVEEDGLENQEFDDDDDHQMTNDELARLDQSLESQVLHENHGAIPKTISDLNEELEKSELDDFGQVLADAWQKNQHEDEDEDDEFKGVDDVDDEESEDDNEEDLVEEEELNRAAAPAIVKKEEPAASSLIKRSVPDDKEKDTQVKKPKLGDTSLTNIAVTEHDVRAVFFVTPKITTTQLVKLFADRVNSRDKQVHFQQLLASLCIKVKEGDTIFFQLKPQK